MCIDTTFTLVVYQALLPISVHEQYLYKHEGDLKRLYLELHIIQLTLIEFSKLEISDVKR